MVYLKQRSKKLRRIDFAVFALAVGWLALMVALTPKQTILGTWHDGRGDDSGGQRIQIIFQSNGIEIQKLVTPQGLLEATANYTLANGAELKQSFTSATLNGRPTSLPPSNLNTSYRCKDAGNVLEFDSRALAVSIPGEDYLPGAWEGKPIALYRDAQDK